MYAFGENYVLPLSHDEVVHGKRALVEKMPGSAAEKLANLRALYGYMWAHPGKKLLFMGGELAQEREWDADGSLDWNLLGRPEHRGVQQLVRDLNRLYRSEPALHELDSEPEGFGWLELHDADANVIAFARFPRAGRPLVCVCNFSGATRIGYRVAFPRPGTWREVLNSDAREYGGGGVGNLGSVVAEDSPWHDQPYSAELTLPPLGVVWLVPEEG
jgi:1,4-alpha-glucan branching enzyme